MHLHPSGLCRTQNQYIATLVDVLEKREVEAHARRIAMLTEKRLAELEARLHNLEARLKKK
jgi:BMFP domain-containing protein YqiC